MTRRCAIIAISLAGFLPAGARADTRADVLAGIGQCAPIADNRAWLDCVYGAAQPMRAALGLPPAPQWRGAPLPPTRGGSSQQLAAPPPQDFGLRAPAAVASQEHAAMASYRFNGDHRFTVVLADGQTWSQLSGDTSEANWSKPASSYTVNITRGAFGSYNLRVTGEPGSFKVARISN